MPLDFPNDPVVGDIFAGAGARWQWDGAKWTSLMTSGGPFLPLTGGALTGPLMLAADPAVALHAATKQYVDAGGSGYLPLTGGELSGNIIITNDNAVGSDPGVSAGLTLSANTGGSNYIQGASPGLGLPWWEVSLGSSPSEGGEGGGSPADFQIARFNDAGALIDYPLTISRATGVVTFGPVPPSTMRRFGEVPAVSATAGVGSLQGHAVNGTVIQGSGSTTDFMLNNQAGAAVMSVPAGTTNVNIAGQINALIVGKGASAGTGTTVVGPVGAGSALTTGNNNTIVGGATGSTIAGTGSNILLSDGAGNIRGQYLNNNAVWSFPVVGLGNGNGGNNVSGGNAFIPSLAIKGTASGTSASGSPYFSLLQVTADTAAATAGITDFQITTTHGGASCTGNRVGQNIQFQHTGGPNNKAGSVGSLHGGLWVYARASGNLGGTTGQGNSWGTLWGGLSSATLQSGATFWNAVISHEFDVGVSTGGSASRIQGIKIVLQNNKQAPILASDYLIGMAATTNADQTSTTGLSFGSDDGYWPIAATGRLISTIASNALLVGPTPYTAAFGIDFSNVTFSTAFLKSIGFLVDGSGNTSMARAGFNGVAAIAKPTVSGAKASNAALASLITALANYGLITDTTTA